MIRWPDTVDMKWSDAVGIGGALISIYCYARVQWRREYAKSMEYSMGNLIGTVMLIISLMYNWNVAAFLSNLAWGAISLYGVYRCLRFSMSRKTAAKQIGGD